MTTSLKVQCAQCAMPLELQLIDWDPTVTPAPQIYRCPICQARHTAHLPGKIGAVVKRTAVLTHSK